MGRYHRTGPSPHLLSLIRLRAVGRVAFIAHPALYVLLMVLTAVPQLCTRTIAQFHTLVWYGRATVRGFLITRCACGQAHTSAHHHLHQGATDQVSFRCEVSSRVLM